MQAYLIQNSIATGRLQLSIQQKFTHYLPISIGLIFPVVWIIIILQRYFKNAAIPPRILNPWIWFIPITVAILIYWLQYRRLKFKVIETSLNPVDALIIFKTAIKNLNWETVISTEKIVVAKVFNGWLAGSWGEQVTIILDGNKIYLNSICNPDKKSSITSYGNNRKNITSFLREISQVAKEQ